MYLLIAKALEEMGLDKEYHPTDYLSFFCLGNREEKEEHNPDNNEAPPSTHVDENSIQVNILVGVLTWSLFLLYQLLFGSEGLNSYSIRGHAPGSH